MLMQTRHRRCSTLILVLALTWLGPISVASAQSEHETRREVERLRSENESLRQQLDDLTQRLADLEAENARLARSVKALAGGSGGSDVVPPPPPPPPAPEQVSIDESKPNASPRALRKGLEAAYAKFAADGPDAESESSAFFRDATRWVKRINRDFTAPIEWTVRIKDARQNRGAFVLTVQAIDPVHETTFGDPFTVKLPAARVRRLMALEDRGELDRVFLKGVIYPELAVDRRRSGTSNAFGQEPLIGPYVVFRYRVDAQSIAAVVAESDEQQP